MFIQQEKAIKCLYFPIFPHIPSWCSKIKERNFTHRGEKGEKEKGLAYKSKET